MVFFKTHALGIAIGAVAYELFYRSKKKGA